MGRLTYYCHVWRQRLQRAYNRPAYDEALYRTRFPGHTFVLCRLAQLILLARLDRRLIPKLLETPGLVVPLHEDPSACTTSLDRTISPTSLDIGFSLNPCPRKPGALYLDETLTLHRLGVYGVLGRSLKTTNGLESINALIEEHCAKVDHWQNSSQRHRWLVTALLDIEPRLRKVMGYRHLPKLRDALKRELKIDTTTSKKKAA